MNAPRTGTLKVPGATLHYETRGSGPVLLLVTGGAGDAGLYAGRPPEFAARVLDYLIRSHALDTVYPAPLPDGMADNPQAAALWCMSHFGNRPHVATPHPIAAGLPERPLPTHSLRHIVGGRNDCLTESPTCHALYKGCSALNKRHMLWAWTSLVMVMFADVYVRLCAMGVWKDVRII